MEIDDALRTTGAVREFADTPVSDDTVAAILDTARFAPNGGNRQAWRVILVKDPEARRQLRDLYLRGWYDYLAISEAGLVPWAPITDQDAERSALARAQEIAQRTESSPGGFAEHLDQVPVMLVVLADLRRLAAVDRDHDRYSMIGGASIYPFVWSILLAAHARGLGGVCTTMVMREETEAGRVLGVPDGFALAALLALGHPRRPQPSRLTRAPVAAFTTVDRFDGTPIGQSRAM
jgi:nitroreductase